MNAVHDPGHQQSLEDLRDLMRLGATGPAPVGLLLDEEVLALADSEPDDLASLPWLATMAGVDPEDAAVFGRRSLLVRGVVRPGPDGQGADVDRHLRTALGIMRQGRGFVRLGCETGDAACLFVSVQPETGVVEEDVTRSGVHAYTVCRYDDGLARAVAWAWATDEGRAPDPAAGSGLAPAEQRIDPRDWPELVEDRLGEARIVHVQGLGYGPDDEQVALQHELAVSEVGALLLRPEDVENGSEVAIAGPVERDGLTALLGTVLLPH